MVHLISFLSPVAMEIFESSDARLLTVFNVLTSSSRYADTLLLILRPTIVHAQPPGSMTRLCFTMLIVLTSYPISTLCPDFMWLDP